MVLGGVVEDDGTVEFVSGIVVDDPVVGVDVDDGDGSVESGPGDSFAPAGAASTTESNNVVAATAQGRFRTRFPRSLRAAATCASDLLVGTMSASSSRAHLV